MTDWSRAHSECQNCGTQVRKHAERGYCKRCLSFIKRIGDANRWNRRDPVSLTTIPVHEWTYDALKAGLDRRDWTDAEFERYRRELIAQYQAWLDHLRIIEQGRNGRITGWDIERQLEFLYSQIQSRPRDGQFHGTARTIEDRFSASQLAYLYGLLLDILDTTVWAGIDHTQLWQAVCCAE